MRAICRVVGLSALLCGIGCVSTSKRPAIRPPKEDLHKPPAGLFAEPTKYPEGVLNHVPLRNPNEEEKLAPPGAGNSGLGSMARPGAGP